MNGEHGAKDRYCSKCGEENLTNEDLNEGSKICKYCFEKQVEFYMEQFRLEEIRETVPFVGGDNY